MGNFQQANVGSRSRDGQPGHQAEMTRPATGGRWLTTGLFTLLGLNLGCDVVYLLPQEDAKRFVDVEVIDASGTTLAELHLKDQTGYFTDGVGAYLMSWPSFEEYGYAAEMVYFNFYPNFEGVQPLLGGEIRSPAGSWGLGGRLIDLEVNWDNDRQFPFVHKGEFVEEDIGGITIRGKFDLSNTNCLSSVFGYDSYDSCGDSYTDGGTYDVSWALHPQYQFCPRELVDEVVGTDLSGMMSPKKLKIGDASLKCVDSYNARHLCGDDPKTIKLDGCEWEVVLRGGPSGYEGGTPTGWFILSATTLCETATVNMCDTWFEGTVTP